MKKILVTGCAGYLGSVLTKKLIKSNYSVLGIDNLSYGGESMLSFFNHKNFKFINVDITKKNNFSINNIDHVIHLAAYVSTLGSVKYPEFTENVNFRGSINLLEQFKSKKIPFLFGSTCSNYGVSKGVVKENAKLNPFGPYAIAKVKVEKEIFKKYKFAKVFRFGTLAGSSLRPRFDTMLNEWILDAISKKIINCYSPNSYRPFIHVDDACEAIFTSIEKWKSLKSNVYNIASFNITKKKLASEISKITKCKVQYVQKGPDKRNYRVDSSKFIKDTDFTFKKNFLFSLKEVNNLVKKKIISNYSKYLNNNI